LGLDIFNQSVRATHSANGATAPPQVGAVPVRRTATGPHQATVSVALLEEPLPSQRLLDDPIQNIGVNLWPNGFHEVARQAMGEDG
jgi:hypothetical protein